MYVGIGRTVMQWGGTLFNVQSLPTIPQNFDPSRNLDALDDVIKGTLEQRLREQQ